MYYLTLVLKPDLEDKAREELLGNIKKKLANPLKEDLWGARELSYPIKHQTKGFYVHLEFDSPPNLVKDLDKTLKVEEDIIRYLLVKVKGQKSKTYG